MRVCGGLASTGATRIPGVAVLQAVGTPEADYLLAPSVFYQATGVFLNPLAGLGFTLRRFQQEGRGLSVVGKEIFDKQFDWPPSGSNVGDSSRREAQALATRHHVPKRLPKGWIDDVRSGIAIDMLPVLQGSQDAPDKGGGIRQLLKDTLCSVS